MIGFHRFFRVVSTHSRPKAAGSIDIILPFIIKSFNTQPPEGGWIIRLRKPLNACLFQHTAARRRLGFCRWSLIQPSKFQHTAARRRLAAFFA